MVLHNPNNWHWVNKDAREWSENYFSEKLTQASASENDVSVKVEKVLSTEGDVDVSQRKGKVITLFDVKIRLEYAGKTASGEEVSGTITIPEVAHDTEEDEFVFDIDVYSDSKEKQPVKDLVRSAIVPQLRKALSQFAGDLIAEHGKDIQHAPGAGPVPTRITHKPISSSASAAAPSKPVEVKISKGPFVNTVTVTDSYEFQTSADQLYQTFVDPQRVAAFTRTLPAVFEPKEGGKFSLFGGNVEGEFKVLEKDKKIVQAWRLGNWPSGHYSTLTVVFDQGSGATVLRLTWEGVPVGEEEVAKKNFEEYYVKSIKTTFGYANPMFPLSFLKLSFISAASIAIFGLCVAWFLRGS
ncbi:Co-chaperone [Rhizina undulata]